MNEPIDPTDPFPELTAAQRVLILVIVVVFWSVLFWGVYSLGKRARPS